METPPADDVTARRESDRRQAFLLKLSDARRTLGDADAVKTAAAQLLGEHLAVNRALHGEVDGNDWVIPGDYERDIVPLAPGRYSAVTYGEWMMETYRRGDVLSFSNSQDDPRFGASERTALARLQIIAALGVGLVKEGRLRAVLAVHSATPRDWTAAEVALVQEVADRTWEGVERATAEAALRDSEAKYRALFESIDEGFCIMEKVEASPGEPLDFRYLEANSAFSAQTGTGSVIGKTIRQAFPAEPETWFQTYDSVVSSGKALRFERVLETPGRTLELYAFPVPGELRQVGVIFKDVSERKRTEAALRESETLLRIALEGGGLGVWRWDLRKLVISGDPAFQAFWGFPPSSEARPLRSYTDRMSPAGQEAMRVLVSRAFAANEAFDGQFEVCAEPGKGRWLRWRGRAEHDRPWVLNGVSFDVTQQRLADDRLRKSEERLRQFGEASQDILWIRDAETLQWVYLTPAFETIYGLSREEALTGDDYRKWQDLIVPEDRDAAVASIARVRDGESVTFELRVRRPSDGTIRWLRNTDFPITDDDGNVALVGGIGHDFTDVREAELRLQTLVAGIPQLVWRAVDFGAWTWASPQWTEYTGQAEADFRGAGWQAVVHPDDRAQVVEAWSHAVEQGGFEVEQRIRRNGDGDYRWFQTRAAPVRDPKGKIIEWLGTSTDIHDLRVLQDQQKVLVAELQHRTRNLMSVVRSIADRTGENETHFADFRSRFRDRLGALARVQSLLSRLEETDRIAFDELIETELEAMNGAAKQVLLDGPRGIRLRSGMVQTLAMALHELATNAVKYGALGQPQARLTIRWRLEPPSGRGGPWLHIDWRESGVHMPSVASVPRTAGQGRELIEEALPYQLSAETSFELGPDGVHCTIKIPVSASNADMELADS